MQIFVSLILLWLCLYSPLSNAEPLHVVLDPGHGGTDHGAIRGKIREAEITLQLSRQLKKRMDKDPRFRASLTRVTDRSLKLKDRAQLANTAKGDVFVSIHVNASLDHRAEGAEIYFQNLLPADEESMFLAKNELEMEKGKAGEMRYLEWPLFPIPGAKDLKPDVQSILKDLQRNYRVYLSSELSKSIVANWSGQTKKSHRHTIRQAPFYVVSHVNMPSVLVEVGFLSNRDEAKLLTDDNYQHQIVESLYKGLLAFRNKYNKLLSN